ncbi:MAG: endonuclease V [Halodesulfurarchaeum sp.]
MEIQHPSVFPDPGLSREEMIDQQRAIAERATFGNQGCPRGEAVAIEAPLNLEEGSEGASSKPIVVGIDQAFEEETAVSALIALQGEQVIETVCARRPLEFPYIPGLLAFREAGVIVEGLRSLSVSPELLLFDGSGRIHYRQAGIATHVGVLFDLPAVGVAKNLLCGAPDRSLEEPLDAGTTVPIRANEDVEVESGTVLGHAVQTRQYPDPGARGVNPLYVSPGHRCGAKRAAALAAATAAGYKLPEPIRLADRLAEECKG